MDANANGDWEITFQMLRRMLLDRGINIDALTDLFEENSHLTIQQLTANNRLFFELAQLGFSVNNHKFQNFWSSLRQIEQKIIGEELAHIRGDQPVPLQLRFSEFNMRNYRRMSMAILVQAAMDLV